ncbi:MAG: hypothetical protein PHG80_04005 [Methanoregulaceae archaeon]|nr:hypothetical protein [Methanoregulaceae archaeon]
MAKNEEVTVESLKEQMETLVSMVSKTATTDAEGNISLPMEVIDVLATPVPGEPRELAHAKEVTHLGATMPKKPESVSIPPSEVGTFELWKNEAIRASIEESLKTAEKTELIETFHKKAAYDDEYAKYREAADNAVAAMKGLVEIINRGIINLGAVPPSMATRPTQKTTGRQSNKARRGDPNLYYVESQIPGKNYVHFAQEASWVVKNAVEAASNAGIQADPEEVKKLVFQLNADGERVYVNP